MQRRSAGAGRLTASSCRSRDRRLVRGPGRREERHAARLRVASSSAARSRMRSSSVIACQRVPRRWPVLRIRPAVSNSRSSLSTSSRFSPAWSASADVVSPPFSDSKDSRRSAGMAFDARRARGRAVVRVGLRDRRAGSPETSIEATGVVCAEVLVRERARLAELLRLVILAVGPPGRPGRVTIEREHAQRPSVLISSFSSRSRLSIDFTIS